jgi:hypothetical protein
MMVRHEPRAGSWYVNKTGKLMKVKLLLFNDEQLTKVLIEFLDGMRVTVNYDAWSNLDLDVIWHDERRLQVR